MAELKVERSALKFLKKLQKADKRLVSQIKGKIAAAVENPDQAAGEQLTGVARNGHPVRKLYSGEYRIILQLVDDVITVLDIGNRKDIYRHWG